MNSAKGHRGFVSKFKALGDTKGMRIPVSISQEIKHMLVLLEALEYNQGPDTATNVLELINEQLASRL